MDWINQISGMLRRHGSLDEPEAQTLPEMANELVAGFTPGVGTAQALRDYERARRKGDYVGMGLSALSAAPVIGGLAKAASLAGPASHALLLPVIAGVGKNKAHTKELMEKAAEASRMLKGGASPEEIWQKLGLSKIRRREVTGGRNPANAMWEFEVRPDGDTFNPETLLSNQDKKQFLTKLANNPIEEVRNRTRYMLMPSMPEGLHPDMASRQIPAPSKEAYKLGELSNHPALDYVPGMKDANVFMFPKGINDSVLDSAGGEAIWSPGRPWSDAIVNVFSPTLLDRGKMNHPSSVLEHELQHLIQTRFGLPRGSNAQWLEGLSKYSPETLLKITNALDKKGKAGQSMADTIRNINKDPFINYLNTTGEQHSRIAQARMWAPEDVAKGTPPWIHLGKNPTLDFEVLANLLRGRQVVPRIEHPKTGNLVVDPEGIANMIWHNTLRYE